jgi:AraC-like DNA-binding protein
VKTCHLQARAGNAETQSTVFTRYAISAARTILPSRSLCDLLAWRMAVAKDMLRRRDLGITDVAERVGYVSASTFSTAFRRYVGQPPRRDARAQNRIGPQ